MENGSTDATAAVARQAGGASSPRCAALSLDRADYGNALRQGFLAAQGEAVAIFDVDYYDLGFLARALAVLDQPGGPSVVVGSKRGPGSVDTRARSRQLVTSVFSTILRSGSGSRCPTPTG